MHFCESLGTFGAKCSCVTGYRLTDDGLSCQPESICLFFKEFVARCGESDTFRSHLSSLFSPTLAEFPCGRTVLTQVNSVFRRTLLPCQNSSLENTTVLDNVSVSASPPSAPATTPTSFLVTNDKDEDDDDKNNQSQDSLLLETSNTTLAPGEEEPEPYRRIVGGDLVIPGEIPWQVW